MSSSTSQPKAFIVVLGTTGAQGGSVADLPLPLASQRVRDLIRKPSSAASKALSAKGVEMVATDFDDHTILSAAFAGANLHLCRDRLLGRVHGTCARP
jgi:uncharacterized protein YbjT (DUF2867 family)